MDQIIIWIIIQHLQFIIEDKYGSRTVTKRYRKYNKFIK